MLKNTYNKCLNKNVFYKKRVFKEILTKKKKFFFHKKYTKNMIKKIKCHQFISKT